MSTDVVVYVWNPALGEEVKAHWTIEGADEGGKIRAAIGAWITTMIGAQPTGPANRWDHKLKPPEDG